jgi:hypothetical protein
MSGIMSLCVNAINVPHASGQIHVRCLNKQVIMVWHKAISSDLILKRADVSCKRSRKQR